MTRLLYWNIRKFGSGEEYTQRVGEIIKIVTAVDPDIFVVTEVVAKYDNDRIGEVVTGEGMDAVKSLFVALRKLSDQWYVIPPLCTSLGDEGVAVFFKCSRGGDDTTKNLYFTGPETKVYKIGVNPSGCLPRRAVPKGALHNAEKAELGLAAKVHFVRSELDMFGSKDYNAGKSMYGYVRAPYMVTFSETEEKDKEERIIRHISVFAIHSPADGKAGLYLQDLGSVPQINDNQDPKEVRVVVGDFNLNLFDQKLKISETYELFETWTRFSLALKPLKTPPDPLKGYEGYFATIIGHPNAIWSVKDETAYHPCHRYYPKNKYIFAVDNIFTRYGKHLKEPDCNHFTILNPIVGSPYMEHGKTPRGSVKLESLMDMKDDLSVKPLPNEGPKLEDDWLGLDRQFLTPGNYYRILNVSDHLPLVIDI